MSYLPPEYYFNGIIYNPQFYNYVATGLTLQQANNLYLGRTGTPVSIATNTTFSNSVAISSGGETVIGGLSTDTLTVSGNSILTGTLSAGATTVTNESITGNLTLSGTPTVNYIQFPDGTKQYTATSNTAVSGLFTGTTNSSSTGTGTVIIPNGGLGVGLNVTAGSIVVNGTSTLTGNTTTGGTLGVTGATTLSSTLNAGASTLAGVTNTANETISGTLGVTGLTTMTTASVTSSTASSSNTTGALIVSGGVASNAKSYFNGMANTNATASTSTTTGAEVITGGIGVGGNSFYGGTLNVAGVSTLAGVTNTANETISGTLGVTGLTTMTTASVTSSTASTSGITGAVIVTGGIGIGGNSYLNATNYFPNQPALVWYFTGNSNSITSGTDTQINYGTNHTSLYAPTTSFYSYASGTGTFTMNTAGLYLVVFQYQWYVSSANNSYQTVVWFRQGVTNTGIRYGESANFPYSNGVNSKGCATALIPLNVNDTLSLWGYQNSGGAIYQIGVATPSATTPITMLSIYKIA